MPIEGFDYKAFSESIAEQAKELAPAELEQREKDFIVNTLAKFSLLAGEALYDDTKMNFTADQAVFITQVVSEWSFHKSIDLIHSGILPQYWEEIISKIAITIFEVAKQAIIRKVPKDPTLQAIEMQTKKAYNACIEDLFSKGIIDEEVKKRAEGQSNFDAMTQQLQEQMLKEEEEKIKQTQNQNVEVRKPPKPKIPKKNQNAVQGVTKHQMKLMTLALVMKVLSQDKVTTILNKFDSNDSKEISQYMNMANLESQLDADLISGCLREIKEYLPIKRKLTKENVLGDLLRLYRTTSREKIERVIKNERPYVKRFIAQAYEGEYSGLPLKVAGIVAQYVEDSI